MSFLSIVLAVLVFGLIVVIHEFGHFIVAKRAGVTIYEFSVGMGPALIKKEHGGIDYCLRLLPIGGYVSMAGETDADDDGADDPDAFYRKPLLARILVLLAGPFNNLLLGYFVLVILTVMNGWVGTTCIAQLEEGTSAYGILQLGDRITAINGHRVYTSNDISYEFLRDEDGLMEITVRRDGETITSSIQFPLESYDGQQYITIDFKVAAVVPTALDYVTYPINWGMSIIKEVWGSVIGLCTGRYAVNELSGPVGVVSAIGQAAKISMKTFIKMVAYITVNIGVMNLLPIPVLDGGRIVLEVCRSIFGDSAPYRKIFRILLAVSMGLLVFLMLYVTFLDITRL